MCRRIVRWCLLLSLCGWSSTSTAAETLRIAAASSVAEAVRALCDAFQRDHDVICTVVPGSSGALASQIASGAPYDVFFSADQRRARYLAVEGVVQTKDVRPFARGHLILIGTNPELPKIGLDLLRTASTDQYIAIADPAVAPYGAAAQDCLRAIDVWTRWESHIITTRSVAEAHQTLASGQVQFAFLALSQWIAKPDIGYMAPIDGHWHQPLIHDAALISQHPLARALFTYACTDSAAQVILQRYGFDAVVQTANTAEPLPAVNPPQISELFGPLLLSLRLAAISTLCLLVLCTPIAWWLARSHSRWTVIGDTLIALPLVLPPTVLGFYLLLLLGAHGPLAALGLPLLAFSPTGMVIGSIIFSAPFVVQPLRTAFATISRRQLEAATMLGATKLDQVRTIILPQARLGCGIAAVFGFAHTLGEFGVVLMIGGNIPGSTRTASMAIFTATEAMQYDTAHIMSAILLALSVTLLLPMYWLQRRFRLVAA